MKIYILIFVVIFGTGCASTFVYNPKSQLEENLSQIHLFDSYSHPTAKTINRTMLSSIKNSEGISVTPFYTDELKIYKLEPGEYAIESMCPAGNSLVLQVMQVNLKPGKIYEGRCKLLFKGDTYWIRGAEFIFEERP